jgi:prephenate dehydratase
LNSKELKSISPDQTIAFQGELGAYSHLACSVVFPKMHSLPCTSFEDVFAAVNDGIAKLAMLPIENSVAGRVADIHYLMPASKLYIIGEFFERVKHHLLTVSGACLEDIKFVYSHAHALGQCRNFIRTYGLKTIVTPDTAGAAAEVALKNDKKIAAIASKLAGQIYGLDSLAINIEDAKHNTTRFLIMSRDAIQPDPCNAPCITTFIFLVRNISAALYKALGGFATNGINMTKLESYQINGDFSATQFYVDIEGHPKDTKVCLALEELNFFSREVRILGVYPAHPYRFKI